MNGTRMRTSLLIQAFVGAAAGGLMAAIVCHLPQRSVRAREIVLLTDAGSIAGFWRANDTATVLSFVDAWGQTRLQLGLTTGKGEATGKRAAPVRTASLDLRGDTALRGVQISADEHGNCGLVLEAQPGLVSGLSTSASGPTSLVLGRQEDSATVAAIVGAHANDKGGLDGMLVLNGSDGGGGLLHEAHLAITSNPVPAMRLQFYGADGRPEARFPP